MNGPVEMATVGEVVMVGDHHVDVLAGKAAGVHTIGVTHGFGTAEELSRAGATGICDSLPEVQRLLGLSAF
jgi:phosphoglycolate phosphatase